MRDDMAPVSVEAREGSRSIYDPPEGSGRKAGLAIKDWRRDPREIHPG